GIVDAKDLSVRNSSAAFAADMIRKLTADSASDAFIMVGPKMATEPRAAGEIADALKVLGRPVFYLDFDSAPMFSPWRDLLGNAVKQARGVEHVITTPRDLFGAWSDVIHQILRSKRLLISERPLQP